MRVFSPPPGYMLAHEATNELMRAMYKGVSHSNEIERILREGIDAWDDEWTTKASRLVDEAILSESIEIYAELYSEEPRRLSPEIWQLGIRHRGRGLRSLAYIDRQVMSHSGVPWSIVKDLGRARLLIEEQNVDRWLSTEMSKGVWPCHKTTAKPKKRQGRPRKIDAVIEVLRNLINKGLINPSMRIKEIHALVVDGLSSTLTVSEETTRRAYRKIEFKFSGARNSYR